MEHTTLTLLLLAAGVYLASGQYVPVAPGAGWRGTYEGSCTFPAGLRVDVATGAETSEFRCLQGRVMSVPAIATWDMEEEDSAQEPGTAPGGLVYSYLQDSAWAAPGTLGADDVQPDLWVLGGAATSVGVRMKPALGGSGALGSQCVAIEFEDGSKATVRSSVYKLGGATIYQEEGYFSLDPWGYSSTCPEADLAPLQCNSTMLTYRCVTYKTSDKTGGLRERLQRMEQRQVEQQQRKVGRSGGIVMGAAGRTATSARDAAAAHGVATAHAKASTSGSTATAHKRRHLRAS